ncbi:gastric triacylglycerol lipase-like [Lytechinus variegatus]|uniref:gastric triacylglycerol lipase-like n=1 Tax=Lytechinus variegatus TaxID=7654 RepID=UPI001BB25202|nr:gastric triacylglycerol lipase-like [Lytechinus variegatus]
MAVIVPKALHVLSIISLIGAITCYRLDARNYRNLGEDPDVNRNASELITSKGYPCKEYSVQTEDGFILGVQRIPYGRNESEYTPRPVVFLQHGLLASATNWLTNLANESLAYILADAGFDVWLGNVRGNVYSRKSIKYKPEDVEFWKWSWDEMAKYDLPAMINLALKETNQRDLFYIGHSQGTTIAFAEFSRNIELASKVKMMYALAPVTRVGNMTSPLRYLTYFLPEIKFLFEILGEGEFMPSNEFVKWLAKDMCTVDKTLCSNVLFVICGFDEKNLNMTRLPVYVTHDPAGTSVMDVVHYAQMVESGTFQMYDYGVAGNMARYNQSTPPLYNPEGMTTPVSIFWGDKDYLADPKDVQWLIPKLTKVIQGNHHYEDYDHLDFIWGMDAPSRVYAPIVTDLKKRSGGTL